MYGETTPFTATGRIRTLRANLPGARAETDHGAVGPALGSRCWARDPLPIPTPHVGHALGRRRERGTHSGPGTLAVGREGPRLGSVPPSRYSPHSPLWGGGHCRWGPSGLGAVRGQGLACRRATETSAEFIWGCGGGMRNTESPTEAGRTRFAFSDLKRPFPDWGWKHPRGWKTGYFIGLRSRTLLNLNPNLLDKEALAGAWGALCDWHPAQDVCS